MIAPIIALSAVPVVAAAGLAAWGAVSPSSQLFGPTLRHTKSRTSIALTFDDGPNPAVTPALLDLLDRHSAHATFFVIGRFARACPDLIREIAARGHAIGNHTDSHPSLAWQSPARIAHELTRCEEAIGAATQSLPRDGTAFVGAEPVSARFPLAQWMRPPYGFRGPQLRGAVRRVGLAGVAMWSLTCYDWRPQPGARLIARLSRALGGDIVLLHDGDHRALGGDRAHVVAALEYWLPRWRDQGMEFVTIDEVAGRQLPEAR